MDVWLLNTNMDKAVLEKLKSLRRYSGAKCCWTDKEDGSNSLNKYFSGFARIIKYADY